MNLDLSPKEYKEIHSVYLDLDILYALKIAGESPKLFWNEPVFTTAKEKLIGLAYLNTDHTLTNKGRTALERFLPEGGKGVTRDFAETLHAELQELLLRLTGRKQKTLQGGKYSFLCNKIDLYDKLEKISRKYGSLDPARVRNTLLGYVGRCHRAGWDRVTLIEYYILKDNTSKLVTDMESVDDQALPSVDGETTRPLIDPKSMF